VKVIEEPQLVVKRKLPWFIDMFLYPMNTSGIIHLCIFLFVPLLIGLIGRLISVILGPYIGIIIALLHTFVIGYMLYYLAECIRDSAKGNWRAPDITIQDMPAMGELLSQILYLLGGAAICFWPAAVYYVFTGQADLIFWILLMCGGFFFPMGVLVVFMFGSISALNPLLILGSIVDTFLPYCGLVLFLYVTGGLIRMITSVLPAGQVLALFSRGLYIYTAMVSAHLLGWFYWWYKDRLDWEV